MRFAISATICACVLYAIDAVLFGGLYFDALSRLTADQAGRKQELPTGPNPSHRR